MRPPSRKDRLIGWSMVFLLGCSSSSLVQYPFCLPPLLPLTKFKTPSDKSLFSTEHIHRQNCLEDYGVKVAVQKLEKIDNSRLQDMWVVTVCTWIVHAVLMYCVWIWITAHVWEPLLNISSYCSHPQSEGHTGPLFFSECTSSGNIFASFFL